MLFLCTVRKYYENTFSFFFQNYYRPINGRLKKKKQTIGTFYQQKSTVKTLFYRQQFRTPKKKLPKKRTS